MNPIINVLDRLGLFKEDDLDYRVVAQVMLAGRPFRIRRSFIADAEEHRLADRISSLGKARS